MLLIDFVKFIAEMLIALAVLRMVQMHVNSNGTISQSIAFLIH